MFEANSDLVKKFEYKLITEIAAKNVLKTSVLKNLENNSNKTRVTGACPFLDLRFAE